MKAALAKKMKIQFAKEIDLLNRKTLLFFTGVSCRVVCGCEFNYYGFFSCFFFRVWEIRTVRFFFLSRAFFSVGGLAEKKTSLFVLISSCGQRGWKKSFFCEQWEEEEEGEEETS